MATAVVVERYELVFGASYRAVDKIRRRMFLDPLEIEPPVPATGFGRKHRAWKITASRIRERLRGMVRRLSYTEWPTVELLLKTYSLWRLR